MSKKFLISTIILATVSFIGFLIIAIILSVNNFVALPIDKTIAEWAYSIRGEKNGPCYWFFRIITEFGYTYFTISIIVILAIIWKFKAKTWFFGGTILFSWILQKFVKMLANRPRPNPDFWWMTEKSTSFPSGHSITVACIFVLLIYFIAISPILKPWLKYILYSLSGIIIALVPLSRIILGVHYFTDVLGGLFFGTCIAILGIIAYNIYLNMRKKFNKNNNKNIARNNNTPEITN